jgi:hypothetical protein
MTEHFYFRGHLCIAMELLSINLYELIKANGFVGFTTALIRRFTSQMLLSLSLMRHHRIVHCDLKPEVRIRVLLVMLCVLKFYSRTYSCDTLQRVPSRLSTLVAAVSSTRKVCVCPCRHARPPGSLTDIFSLYLYSESFLSVPRSHSGHERSYGHRHVESRLHFGGAVHGLPHIPGRE